MALSADRKAPYKEGVELPMPVGAAKTIYAGSLVNLDGTTRAAEAASDATGKVFAGVATQAADNAAGSEGDLDVILRRRGVFLFNIYTSVTQDDVGKSVFIKDDQTVALSASVTYSIYCGFIAAIESSTQVWVDIFPALLQTDVAVHIADTSAAHAASAISIADAGNHTATAQVEAALQEIYASLLTAKGITPIPMPTITDAGVALAAFSDGASPTPGFCVTAKGLGIRWNNHATPGAVGTKVIVPPDADVTANMVLHILAAKTGATVGDATKFTVVAYNNDVGAAYDADSDFGGDTGAMTGDATAKTVQEVTLTLALANLTAYPAAMELTLKPKDGTLGTDDVIMLAAWIEYQKKLLTA
jgi:hypothetical protein